MATPEVTVTLLEQRRARAEQVAATLLYEGYLLYPYRASSAKNRSRWTFGSLYPHSVSGEPHRLQVQCLLRAPEGSALAVRVRFLQVMQCGAVQRALEREAGMGRFRFEAGSEGEGEAPGEYLAIEGELRVRRERLDAATERVCVEVENLSCIEPGVTRERAALVAFASTHLLLEAPEGRFVSSIDPPRELQAAAAACRNEGAWPVLIGSESDSQVMLASPIILYDDPQVAPESPGALYDATEIDEILSLRVLTLTDGEKREAARFDERARRLIERTESLTPAQWEALHGAFRDPEGARAGMRVGQRVRIHPSRRADVMDIMLAGKTAIIEAIEQDYERRTHVAVALEDDPGRDLGFERMPGHRFFFSPEELEPLA